MKLYEQVQEVGNAILGEKLIELAIGYEINPVRKDLFENCRWALARKLGGLHSPSDLGPGSRFGKLGETVAVLQQLQALRLFDTLRNPPAGAACTPMPPRQLARMEDIAARVKRLFAAADAVAAPANADRLETSAIAETPAYNDAIRLLREFLSVAQTDEWGMGSARLDRILDESRDIVAAAGPAYVVFSRQQFDDAEAGFWSNDNGWTELTGATLFSQCERDSLRLPKQQDAVWMEHAAAGQLVNALMEAPKP